MTARTHAKNPRGGGVMAKPWCYDCHNTGERDCYCGGDMCVCKNYGTYPCPTCEDWDDDEYPDQDDFMDQPTTEAEQIAMRKLHR